jgi:hypothetical protein
MNDLAEASDDLQKRYEQHELQHLTSLQQMIWLKRLTGLH